MATAGTQWMTAREAQKSLGVGYQSLRRLAEEQRISTRQLPGMPPRYRREDVEHLLAESIRPATAGAK